MIERVPEIIELAYQRERERIIALLETTWGSGEHGNFAQVNEQVYKVIELIKGEN